MTHLLKLWSGGLFLCCVAFSLHAAETDETAALLAKVAKPQASKTKLSKEEIAQLIILHSEFSSVRAVTHEQRLDIVRALSGQFAAAPRECIAVFNEILAAATSVPVRLFAHRFIAACYENMPASAEKNKAAQHLLRFAELKYGKESERYAYFQRLKDQGLLGSAAYMDLFRFDAGYAQSKIHLAYWNMKDGDKRLQSIEGAADAKKQTEAVLQEYYHSGLMHLSTVLGKEQRAHKKFIQLSAALHQRLAANYYLLAQYDTCLENVQAYMAWQPEYANDITAIKVWYACSEKTAELSADATDFMRLTSIMRGRIQLEENFRLRVEREKDEKTKRQLEKILRSRFVLEKGEVENWQPPGILFGDRP